MVGHTINTDWVELNLKCFYPDKFDVTDQYITPDGQTIFKREGNGNKFYKNYFRIYHQKKDYGIALTNSRSPELMSVDNVQLKINNNKLYELGWLDSLKNICDQTCMNYRSALRLDIALDGGDYFKVFELWRSGAIDKVGRAKVTTHYTGKRKVEGYYIGMSKSKKKLVCYNKTEEIKRSNKYYIEKFWKRCGLATKGNVERLELKIKNEENKKIVNFDWEKLDNFEYLASLMRTNLKGFFEFVEISSHKNISRKKRIEPINWNDIGGSLLDKDSTRNTSEVWSGKVAMKKLWEIHFVTGKKIYYDIAFDIACNIECIEWMNACIPHWKDKMEKKMGKNPDGEIIENWVTNFKEYSQGEQISVFDKRN